MRKTMIFTILAILAATVIAAAAFCAIAPEVPKKSVYMTPLLWSSEIPNLYKFDDKVNLRDADIVRDGSVQTGSREGACELRSPYTTDGLIYTISANWQFTGEVTMEVSATGKSEDYKPITNGVPLDYSNFMPGTQLKWRAKLGPNSALREVRIVYTDLSGVAGSFGNPDLSGFTVKKVIYIKGSSKGPLYNFQIPIKVGESEKMGQTPSGSVPIFSGNDGCDIYLEGPSQSNLSDIRFTCADGETNLPYYRESVTGAKPDREAVFWVKIPEIPKDGLPIYMYYGKDDAADLSDGKKVFEFFDDFSDPRLDIKIWRVLYEGRTSKVSTAGSVLNIDAAKAITDHYNFEDGIIEYRAKVSGNGGIGGIILAGRTPDSDIMAYSSIMAANAHCIMQGPRVISNDPKQIELDKYYNFRVAADRGGIVFQRYGDGWSEPQAETRCSLGSSLRPSSIGLSAGQGGSGLYCEWIRTRKYADPLPQVDKNKTGKEEAVNLPAFNNLTLAPDGSIILVKDAMEGTYTSALIRAPFDARILIASWEKIGTDPEGICPIFSISTDEGSSYYAGWQNGAAKYASKKEFQKGSQLRYKAVIARRPDASSSLRGREAAEAILIPGLKKFSLAYYPGEIKVLLPSGGEKVSPGGRYNIFWDAKGYEPSYGMDLYYSKDGGKNYIPVASKVLNSGSYTWALPDEEIAKAVIKVVDPYDKDVYGTSGVFAVTKEAAGTLGEEIKVENKEEDTANKEKEVPTAEKTVTAPKKIKDESSKIGDKKLYELLIKSNALPADYAKGSYQNGDIVAIRPTGYMWGANARLNFKIVRMYLTEEEVKKLLSPKEQLKADKSGRRTKDITKRRGYKIDITRRNAVEKRETTVGGITQNVPLVNEGAVVLKD